MQRWVLFHNILLALLGDIIHSFARASASTSLTWLEFTLPGFIARAWTLLSIIEAKLSSSVMSEIGVDSD